VTAMTIRVRVNPADDDEYVIFGYVGDRNGQHWLCQRTGGRWTGWEADYLIIGSLFCAVAHALLSNGCYDAAAQLVEVGATTLRPELTTAAAPMPWKRGTSENTNRLLREYLPRAPTSPTTRSTSTSSPASSTTSHAVSWLPNPSRSLHRPSGQLHCFHRLRPPRATRQGRRSVKSYLIVRFAEVIAVDHYACPRNESILLYPVGERGRRSGDGKKRVN